MKVRVSSSLYWTFKSCTKMLPWSGRRIPTREVKRRVHTVGNSCITAYYKRPDRIARNALKWPTDRTGLKCMEKVLVSEDKVWELQNIGTEVYVFLVCQDIADICLQKRRSSVWLHMNKNTDTEIHLVIHSNLKTRHSPHVQNMLRNAKTTEFSANHSSLFFYKRILRKNSMRVIILQHEKCFEQLVIRMETNQTW